MVAFTTTLQSPAAESCDRIIRHLPSRHIVNRPDNKIQTVVQGMLINGQSRCDFQYMPANVIDNRTKPVSLIAHFLRKLLAAVPIIEFNTYGESSASNIRNVSPGFLRQRINRLAQMATRESSKPVGAFIKPIINEYAQELDCCSATNRVSSHGEQ